MEGNRERLRVYEKEDRVPKRYQDEVKKVNKGLYIVWDTQLERWRLKHFDERTGLVRDVFLVETENGDYEHLNMGIIRMLKDTVCWDLIAKYPDPKDIYLHIVKEHRAQKASMELERRGVMVDWNRRNKDRWGVAFREFQRRVKNNPRAMMEIKREEEKRERDRKIIIT